MKTTCFSVTNVRHCNTAYSVVHLQLCFKIFFYYNFILYHYALFRLSRKVRGSYKKKSEVNILTVMYEKAKKMIIFAMGSYVVLAFPENKTGMEQVA